MTPAQPTHTTTEVSEAIAERLPLTFKETADYAEVYDAKGELVALTTRPEFFEALAVAALSTAPPGDGVPGMVLVPREPNGAMLAAGNAILNFTKLSPEVWAAMVDAALSTASSSGRETP